MSEQHVCKKCGGALNIVVSIDSYGTAALDENGRLVINEIHESYIDDVKYLGCANCGAAFGETGFGVMDIGRNQFYLWAIHQNTEGETQDQ